MQGGDVRGKEIALEVLELITDYVKDWILPHANGTSYSNLTYFYLCVDTMMISLQSFTCMLFVEIIKLYRHTLNDSNATLQLSSLRGCTALIVACGDISGSTASLSPLLPPMCKVIEAALTNGNEDAARDAIEAIIEIVDEQPKVIKASVGKGYTYIVLE